jgi:hypothetical protein
MLFADSITSLRSLKSGREGNTVKNPNAAGHIVSLSARGGWRVAE